MTPAPQQVLRDALTAKCIQGSSPLQSLIELAQKAGVGVKTIAKASAGHPIPTVDHLRLCASDRKACQVIGIKAGTLKRLKLAHALPIGPVLRACTYIGVHPFGYFGTVTAGNVSRETVAEAKGLT